MFFSGTWSQRSGIFSSRVTIFWKFLFYFERALVREKENDFEWNMSLFGETWIAIFMMEKIICSQHILRKIPRTPKALSHIKHLFVMIYNLILIWFGKIWIQFDFIPFEGIKISFLLKSLTFPLWSFSSVDFQRSSLIFQETKDCGCQVANHGFSWPITIFVVPSYSKNWRTSAVK